jgi:hypothetical protein
MNWVRPFLCLFACLIFENCFSQNNALQSDGIIDFPLKLVQKLNQKAATIDEKILKQTENCLQKLMRQEERIKRKVAKEDSVVIKDLFDPTQVKYREFLENLKSEKFILSRFSAGEYLPYFDSIKTSLRFLEAQNAGLNNPEMSHNLSEAISSFNSLQGKLKYVTTIRRYLKERKTFLREQLNKYGLSSQLRKFSKEVYYYSEYIKEYKAILNDPSKQELEALRLLNKIPAFRDFVGKNSFLSSLFGADSYSLFRGTSSQNIPDIPGLQTRSDVLKVVNPTIATPASGQVNHDIFSQKLGDIKNQLQGLKNRTSAWDDNAELPDFKPNEMKTKPFWKKIEVGANFQFGRANSIIPSTADFGLQIGYKVHQNGSFGLGLAYKTGLGRPS